MTKQTFSVHKTLKPLSLILGVSLFTFIPVNHANAEPPKWHFVDEFKDYIAITEPTEKVIGHRPGIETFALVKNGASGLTEQLELCDTVKITYRILDKDADWADINAIAESVRWFIFKVPAGEQKPEDFNNIDQGNIFWLVSNDSTNDNEVAFDLRYRDFEDTQLSPEEQNLSLRLLDHIKLKNEATGQLEQQKLKAFINTQTKDGSKIYLGYTLYPITEIGEPIESSIYAEVINFEKITRLSPEIEIGDEQVLSEVGDVATIMQQYSLGDRFQNYGAVLSNEIKANNISCVLPPPIKDSPYLIGYYLVQEEIEDTEPVDYLVADEKYIVQFFYDENKNRVIDDEDENITQKLLADGATDYVERPFINGLRLDLAFNSNGINLNSYEDLDNPNNNSVFLEETIVDNSGVVDATSQDPDTAVSARGIPLDRYRNEFKNGGSHFFWIENDSQAQRQLYFETVEGKSIPEELLDTTNVPKVLPIYFEGNAENATTLQQFIINVKSAYPKGYEGYEDNTEETDMQGGSE